MEHRQPVYNQTVKPFKADTEGREKATQVLDHALKLRKKSVQQKTKSIQSATAT